MPWWALFISSALLLLVGGLFWDSRRCRQQLGAARSQILVLQDRVEFLASRLAVHAGPDPDLDELDRVFNGPGPGPD